jgi:hypothetical protein
MGSMSATPFIQKLDFLIEEVVCEQSDEKMKFPEENFEFYILVIKEGDVQSTE